MRWISSAIVVVLGTLLPSAHALFERAAGARGAYALGTLLLVALGGLLVACWPRTVDERKVGTASLTPSAVVSIAGLALLFWVSFRLLPPVFAGPLDANRGDMLVIIEHAITNVLNGGNPYAVHRVPWEAPLSYGPVLWLPFVVPHELDVDVRILTLVAQLVVPACFVLAAATRAGDGHTVRAISLFGLAVALALNPSMLRFHEIGHTQIYWPLILVFAITVARGASMASAIVLGLLVAARTTMVAIVPVWFLHMWASRTLTVRNLAALALSATLPFLPFVLADPASVYYALFGVYLKVMKGFVWYSTSWAQNTYGVTGRLLERGFERYVEVAQIVTLIVVYVLSWRSLRRGGRPEPWMVLALLVFSMTTLWPVGYLYFDVWILAASGLLAADVSIAPSAPASTRRLVAVAAVSAAVVLVSAAVLPGARFTLDIGDPAVAGFTGGGFGRDLAVTDAGRQVVWIEGETARVRVPRAGWHGATIRVAIRPHAPHDGRVQRVAAALNGRAVGVTTLREGWQEIAFASRGRDWRYGFNVLELQFSYAAPSDGDPRPLSAAIDWLQIE